MRLLSIASACALVLLSACSGGGGHTTMPGVPSGSTAKAAVATEIPSSYTITEMPPLPGNTESFAMDINNFGAVAGASQNGLTAPLPAKATLFSGGTVTPLTPPGTFGQSVARAINDAGVVVGFNFEVDAPPDPSFSMHAVEFHGPTTPQTDLGQATVSGGQADALAINSAGTVVGWVDEAAGRGAVIFQPPLAPRVLGLGQAFAINAAGTIVGVSGDNQPVIFTGSTEQPLGTLGTFPGSPPSGFASGINDAGTIVGSSSSPLAANRAFIFKNGTMTDLGAPPGGRNVFGRSINNGDLIVGDSDVGPWVKCDSAPVLLAPLIPPNSGWVLQNVRKINDKGQIVGSGLHNGVLRGFVLTPNS